MADFEYLLITGGIEVFKMEVIDEQLIKRKGALDSTYSKGKQIFKNEEFIDLSISKTGERSVEFSSEVLGSRGKTYGVSIELEVNENKARLKEYFCPCPAFSTYGGFCKHLVAVALQINFEYDTIEVEEYINDNSIGAVKSIKYDNIDDFDDVQADDDFLNFNNKKKRLDNYLNTAYASASGRTFTTNGFSSNRSSRELLEAITNYSIDEKNKYRDDFETMNVVLEPYVHFNKNRMLVEWKVGIDRMYVVKNIYSFVRAVKNKEFVKYGKSLEFVHERDAFSAESLAYIDFLLALRYPQDFDTLYAYSDKRYIVITESLADNFISIFKNREMNVIEDYSSTKKSILVKESDIKLPVSITGTDNGKKTEISFPKTKIYYGNGTVYILYEDILYCVSNKYSDKMKNIMPLIENSNHTNSYARGYYYNFEDTVQPFTLYEQDYMSFANTILPIMEKYMNVDIQGVDFDIYEKEEGKYEVYFDIDGNDIICHAKAIYGDKEHYLSSMADEHETYRDLQSEYNLRKIIRKYFPVKSQNNKFYILGDNDDLLADLVEYGVGEIEQLADVYASDEFKKIKVTRLPKISTGLSIKGDLLDVSWNIEGMSMKELNDILDSYRRKRKYHRLKSGELLNISDEGLEFLNDLQEDFRLTDKQLRSGTVQLPMYRALYLDSLVKDNLSNIFISKDSMYDNLINSFEEVKNQKFDIPSDINAQLRPYQVDGFKWAKVISKLGFGGVLADDMGLGKTLEMITYLYSEKGGCNIVICPASLVYNWESEFNKFTPQMKVCSIVGTAAEREELLNNVSEYDVVITSYDLLKRDISLYKTIEFDCEIIDEAQYIKNASTLAAKAVKTINSKRRFALTGTPIENRLSELWSIFEYLMPGYLFSYKYFKEVFEEKILPGTDKDEKTALVRLHKMISPFIMRRLKKDVLKDLPDKIEEVVYARFENEQEKIYMAAEKKILSSLKKSSNKDFQENKLQILAELTKLRQICCDPSLVYENYNKESAKLTTCVNYIENGISSGHKILLFSQFTTMLDILKEKLQQNNLRVFMLTGSTSKKKRRELVEAFQEGGADVFLISLKAGGTGLNLTAADIVIHYDPWWNVAAQNQATDRAHRIGQKNKVNVIKLIAKNSIEERILKLQEKKKELADKIISGENTSLSSFTKEDLLELFE